MVEVFKTNITVSEQAEIIVSAIQQLFPSFKINIDLEDCDKILRAEAEEINVNSIITILMNKGYHCEKLH